MTFNDVDERAIIGDVDERAKPAFPTSKLNQLSTLITESSSKGTAKDFLSNLLKASEGLTQPTKTIQTSEPLQPALTDKLLQDSKNSLQELQKQLKISESNDEASADKKASTNTQQLLEMIGTILEMTQKKMLTEQQPQGQLNLDRDNNE